MRCIVKRISTDEDQLVQSLFSAHFGAAPLQLAAPAANGRAQTLKTHTHTHTRSPGRQTAAGDWRRVTRHLTLPAAASPPAERHAARSPQPACQHTGTGRQREMAAGGRARAGSTIWCWVVEPLGCTASPTDIEGTPIQQNESTKSTSTIPPWGLAVPISSYLISRILMVIMYVCNVYL